MTYHVWLDDKPEITEDCIMVTAGKYANTDWNYSMFTIELTAGEDENGEPSWYFGIFDDGDEWGDLSDLHANKYLLLPMIK